VPVDVKTAKIDRHALKHKYQTMVSFSIRSMYLISKIFEAKLQLKLDDLTAIL